MALICMAVHDTEENKRSKYTAETLQSLCETVDLEKHFLFISDNNSCLRTQDIYEFLPNHLTDKAKTHLIIVKNKTNLGTAGAINLGIKLREKNQVIIKIDNDCVVHEKGWVEKLEEVFNLDPTIGIAGLKRDDIPQNPNHPDPEARTILEQLGEQTIEICPDIMGTCTAFNPLLLDKIGYMNQPSVYGFDDVLISVRSIAAGFRNCFFPDIKITHLDEGGDAYCDWKKREAGVYLQEVSHLINMYKTGKLDPYYDGGFDD